MIAWRLNYKILDHFKDLSAEQEALIKKAWQTARRLHAGQKRKSGQAYFIHPLAVADHLAIKFQDPILTVAALLHDTVEDCPNYLMGDLYQDFGSEVGFLVDSVTKQRDTFYLRGQSFYDDVERLLWAGDQDVRCLLLKIADRQHNVNTIGHLPNNKQIRMAFETQAILLPMKDILKYDQVNLTIKQATKNWQKFLTIHKFDSPLAIKNDLYQRQFVGLNCETYNLMYNYSNSVIWQITDQELFKKLLTDQNFNQTTNILRINSNGHNFEVEFQFHQGYVNPDQCVQLEVSKFST